MERSELPVFDDQVYHLGLKSDQLADQIFLVGDPKRANDVANHFDIILDSESNREYVIKTGIYKKMPVSVIGIGMGTDNVEIALVEAYILKTFDLENGGKKDFKKLTIIRLGTSGGWQKEAHVGSLGIAEYGFGLDNTGLFYDSPYADDLCREIEQEAFTVITNATPLNNRFKGWIHPYVSKANDDVVKALVSSAEARDAKYIKGITAASSGFYGPQDREVPGLKLTIPNLQKILSRLNFNGKKIINCEMESSLLFHLGRQMNYKCGTVCAIIANRETGEFLEDYSGVVDNCIRVGLDAMFNLWSQHQNG